MSTIEILNNWEDWLVHRNKINDNFDNLNTDKLEDAPSDWKQYAREDWTWSEVEWGSWVWDMTKAVYDPNTKEADAFSMDEMDETATKKILTDTERTKLAWIEAWAEANIGVEYTQTEKDKLTGIENGAEVNVWEEYTTTEKNKLATIEENAEINQTDAEIKVQYENNADTNAFTDDEKVQIATNENDINILWDALANLASAQGKIKNDDTTDITTTKEVISFDVVTDSNNTDIFEFDATAETITFKKAWRYNFQSNLNISSTTNSTINATFSLEEDDDTVKSTQTYELNIDNGSSEVISLNTLLVVEEAEIPLSLDINVVWDDAGMTIETFASILISQSTSWGSVSDWWDITWTLSDQIDLQDALDNKVESATWITNIEEVTKAEYDALTPDANTIYNITDETPSDIYVALTEDQTIEGIKTFNESPIVPEPTTDLQVATKKYVDDNSWGGNSEIFSVTMSSGQGLTTTDAIIAYDDELIDTWWNFNTTTYKYTAPSDWFYSFSSGNYIYSLTDWDRVLLRWYKNDTLFLTNYTQSYTAGKIQINMNMIVDMLNWDTFYFKIKNETRDDWDMSGSNCIFSWYKLN